MSIRFLASRWSGWQLAGAILGSAILGCAARLPAVVSSSPVAVDVELERGGSVSDATRLAQEECEKHGRIADFDEVDEVYGLTTQTAPGSRIAKFACVDPNAPPAALDEDWAENGAASGREESSRERDPVGRERLLRWQHRLGEQPDRSQGPDTVLEHGGLASVQQGLELGPQDVVRQHRDLALRLPERPLEVPPVADPVLRGGDEGQDAGQEPDPLEHSAG